jgi:LysM repeat protein
MQKTLAHALLAAVVLALVAQPVAGGDELIVQPGDTLWDIAKTNGTTVSALAGLNGIANPSLIAVGQRIVLHPPTPAAAPPPAPAAPPAPTVYVVRDGDTLWAISVRYSTTVAVLAAANQIANPSFIRVGQALLIPQEAAATPPTAAPAAPAPPPPAPPPPIVHVVRAGDTLWVISARYGVSIDAIVSANGLASASFIRIGQQLVIPGTTTTPATAGAVTNAGMSAAMAAKVVERAASRELLLAAAREFGVSGPFVLAVSWHESGWQTGAVSGAGAIGLMQLMPSTADWVADAMLGEAAAIDDPAWNARAGTRLLAFYLARYQGSEAKALAAYFQGMTSVETIGILVSTQPYIDSILGLEQIFSY